MAEQRDSMGLEDLILADLVVTASNATLDKQARKAAGDFRAAVYELNLSETNVKGLRGEDLDIPKQLEVKVLLRDGEPRFGVTDLVGPLLLISIPQRVSTDSDRPFTVVRTIELTDEGAVISDQPDSRNDELTRFLDQLVAKSVAQDRRAALLAWMDERAQRGPRAGAISLAYAEFYSSEHASSAPTTVDSRPQVPVILETAGFSAGETRMVGLESTDGHDLLGLAIRMGSTGGMVGRTPGERWRAFWVDREGARHIVGSFDPNALGLEDGIKVRVRASDKPTLEVTSASFDTMMNVIDKPHESRVFGDPN